MGRYNFSSVGGAARNAIDEFFIRQATDERQRMLDAQRMKAQEDEVRQRDAQIQLQQQQEARIAQAQQQSQGDLETEREFRRASTIHQNAMPGILDPGTADLLRKQGFGDIVTQGQPTQGAAQFDPTQINDVAQYDVIPGVLETKGGTAYQQARAAEDARAAQATQAQAAASERAREAQTAAAERGREHDQTLAAIRGGANAGAAESRALRDQLAKAEGDRKQEKFDAEKSAAAQVTANSATAQQTLGNDMLRELDRLQTQTPDKTGYGLSSGTQKVVGAARVPGIIAGLGLPGTGTDSLASIKALVAKLDLNKLRELKSQSKTGATGFGALSERELNVLENAAAMLDTAQSEPQFNERLNEIRAAAQKLTQAGGSSSGGSSRVYYDSNGNPIQR